MNEHALSVLEFEEALHRVAARAGSSAGREAVLALRPRTDLEGVRTELARVEEVVRFQEMRTDWAPPVTPSAGPALKILEMDGAVLEPGGVLLLARLLDAAHQLRTALEPFATSSAPSGEGVVSGDREPSGSSSPPSDGDGEHIGLPHLSRLRSRLAHRPELQRRLDEIVDPDGSVRDDASPELKRLRRQLRSARSRIVQQLERYLDSLPDRIRVSDASVSVRDGRYVIPIRREGKSSVGGIIHGESATGATLFVEPPVALRLMNELQELEREEAREIQRILREVTGRCRAVRPELASSLEALVDFDSLWARGRSARAWDGIAPKIAAPGQGELRIVGGRHPLLLEQSLEGKLDTEVVPFNLSMDEGERALVVSGPNTGGKTVFLKSMGLIHLLAQSGIIPPLGSGSRLPLLTDVFADIGDEQSIAESLSTFSAHMANAIEILEGAGSGTLVLMDEMGTGTDPSEGAALARAILEILVERDARAIVTSHLGALKRLDAEGSGIVNASLLFDPGRIAPTYELQKGRPGRSYGLAIARRLGLPEPVLERAESYADSGELEVENLLSTLEEKERELSAALEEARTARERAERLEAEAEAREARLNEREETSEARAREEARQLLLDARREVEEAIREVRRAGEEDEAELEEVQRRARRRVEEAAREQRRKAPDRPHRPRERSAPGAFTPGDPVRVTGSGARGTVLEVDGDRVTVEVKGMRLQMPPDRIEVTSEPAPKPDPGLAGGWTGPDVNPSHEADLRGLRVDEVELELGRALDGAVLGGLGELRVIHGKGTGAVKARVQELLQRDRRVAEFRGGRHGEGGGGVTVVQLR